MTPEIQLTKIAQQIPSMLAALSKMQQSIDFFSEKIGVRLTRNELCERLGIAQNTLRAWQKKPGFPKLGNDGRFGLSDVVRWERGE